jgi:peptidoglycan/xylan/chitin deacetylase (PgdA/CDA1 family)
MRSHSRWMLLIGMASLLCVLWTGTASAASASVVHKGPSDRKQIALTFDDNTKVERGVATLRALQKNQVPATLFLIGSSVKGTSAINTEIVKGMKQGLFEVGDHTWSHPVLPSLSTSAMASQIGGGTDAFRATTGARTVPLFRPPYGSTNSRVAAVAGSEGFRYLVLWDIDPRDWAGGSASTIANHVISRAHNGAIVVMHLSAAHTAAAIPVIVSELRARGYEFVTVSTMLKGNRLFLDVDAESSGGRAIARMASEGFMSGYDGNYFGPGDSITRAQVAKVAALVGGLHTPDVENADSPSFADVSLLHDSEGNALAYPFDYVEEAAAAGLVMGSVSDGGGMVFRPTEAITRVQFAQILARMARQLKGYGVEGSTDPSGGASPTVNFGDVPDYAVADVALVAGLGLMSGYSTDRFSSWAGAQRSHVAVAMSRYLDLPAVWPGSGPEAP